MAFKQQVRDTYIKCSCPPQPITDDKLPLDPDTDILLLLCKDIMCVNCVFASSTVKAISAVAYLKVNDQEGHSETGSPV